MSTELSREDVRHVAALARLALSDDELEAYREQLADVLSHVETLRGLDVENVEPLSHPTDETGRLADDRVSAPMPRGEVLDRAPASEGPFLAVPKVLLDGGGG